MVWLEESVGWYYLSLCHRCSPHLHDCKEWMRGWGGDRGWLHPVLEGQEEGLQLDSPTEGWALESLWMRVHGQNVWQVWNTLWVAQGILAISLSSIERDVSGPEGGDVDIGSIRYFKANWWHHFGAWQRSLSSQVPLPSSRNFPGDAELSLSHGSGSKPPPAWACSEPALSSELLQELRVWHHWLFVQKTKNEAKIRTLRSLEILGKSFPLERVVLLSVCGAAKLLLWVIRAQFPRIESSSWLCSSNSFGKDLAKSGGNKS